jgi:hypothetical protein
MSRFGNRSNWTKIRFDAGASRSFKKNYHI